MKFAKSFYTLKNTFRDMRSINIILVSIVILVSCVMFTSAAQSSSTNNATYQQTAKVCLNESYKTMVEMASANFSVLRVNDTITQAQSLYDAQVALKEKRKTYDFGLVTPYCDEIKKIKQDAFIVIDEYSSLLQFYADQKSPGMNTSTIDVIISEITLTMSEERYEDVPPMIEKANAEIVKVKSEYTALNIFLDYTTQSLGKFLYKNRWTIIITLSVLLILFIAYRVRILRWIVQRKMQNLKIRKNTIKELIMKTQKSYFQEGKIPESEYNIKTKKFAELIRDIDRQIPLLQEQLVKLGVKIRDK